MALKMFEAEMRLAFLWLITGTFSIKDLVCTEL